MTCPAEPAAMHAHRVPHNLDAEQSVLALAMSDPRALNALIATLRREDFYEPRNQMVYDAINELVIKSRAVDLLTVYNQLVAMKKAEAMGGMPYLTELTAHPFLIQNANEYIQIVREKSVLRKTIRALSEVVDLCREDTQESSTLLSLAAKRIYELSENQDDSAALERIHTILSRNIDALFNPKPHAKPITSGFLSADRMIGGFQRGTLTILAARPAMGKSAFALNVATLAAQLENRTVAIFSLEMSKEELGNRILSSVSQIESKALQPQPGHPITPDKEEALSKAFSSLLKANLYIDDRAGMNTTQMMAKCRQLKLENQGGLDLVIIDYLQLMSGAGRRGQESRQQEISEISRSLKLMAKELDVPVIALSQLSRACEQREDKRPLLSDLRESGSLEQDADIVLFLYRPAYYDKEREPAEHEQSELIIAKNRSGATGKVHLGWTSRYTRFFDLTTLAMQAPAAGTGGMAGPAFASQEQTPQAPNSPEEGPPDHAFVSAQGEKRSGEAWQGHPFEGLDLSDAPDSVEAVQPDEMPPPPIPPADWMPPEEADFEL